MSSDEARTKRKRGRGADPGRTRDELVEAAAASLLEEGYRGTTARSIASRADCNQAAIYYHFGGIEPLLIEALDRSSARRLERYRESLTEQETLPELVRRLAALYAEDRETGHFALLTELLGGVTASPELQAGIEATTKPWLEFIEERVASTVRALPFGAALPADDLADLVFSVVVGVELRSRVDGNTDRADRLFRLAELAATLVQSQPPEIPG
ncbi:MAG: TetR/AcrR family transcriptional regulator [Acidimicrobiales bacterium]